MSVSSLISPAVDQLADLALWEAEFVAGPQLAASSLAERLAKVPDPRAGGVAGTRWWWSWCWRRARRWWWAMTR